MVKGNRVAELQRWTATADPMWLPCIEITLRLDGMDLRLTSLG